MVAKNIIAKIIFLFCAFGFLSLYASEIEIIKKSIISHFGNSKIIFLDFLKVNKEKYSVIIKYNNEQEIITISKEGKILNIIDDLSIIDKVEEGC